MIGVVIPPDDTASAPHESNATIVEFPAVNLGSFSKQHEPLGIRDDLRGIKCLPYVLHKFLPISRILGVLGAREMLGRFHAFILEG